MYDSLQVVEQEIRENILEWASKMHQFILRLYKLMRHGIIDEPERKS